MMIIEQLITSFISTAGFGILFNVPKQTLLKCGMVGMVGWLIYVLLDKDGVNAVMATLTASFFVAVISQIFAKLYKSPVIIFSVAGIIPLVPGGLAYDAMRHFVENDYNTAIALAAKATMLSGAIAMGLVFSEVVNQTIRNARFSIHK
ncbi:threonine/serine exporter [Bacillus sp. DNRA2]|uniref:threonine/serine exporter family protein n=1 Tax=Bacillus sp. DNRA2 TaxID=2723053 RepID=UPI00145F0761|nr:threonine/serine exporter family protein [Bacillus sp. DNRA2]NMD69716.1 threonine/serine exporter [Bacillus sp. DNRA2]